ncbi:unconventional myosin-Vb-like isoform X2 [Ascaphus truei]|uniref:unconventional myosin-Vb-like isoform X2 n=1 Tax=Ascaphus truei TaxID=8439 RepID=UPI003F5A714C
MCAAGQYCEGTGLWIPDAQEVWKPAVVTKDYHEGDKFLYLRLLDGSDLVYSVSPSTLPPLRNPDLLVGENDLTALSYLHEAGVLHSLRVRFLQGNNIYTYCGIVLVAVNPYEQLPIYGEDVIGAYIGKARGELDPHIFAVAEEAYMQMGRDSQNQSIIISGESGAGKTVSAKYVMRYFAMVGGACGNSTVEERVLASNPIMEAIGNAQTIRNDNSSRFGKYVEIGFSPNYRIIGASMKTYLLEKTRVTFQAMSERNYHIFYQLCDCSSQPEFQGLCLVGASEFHYTNQGGALSAVVGGERSDLQRTRNAFSLLGVSSADQFEIFRVIASILHLGNVVLRSGDRHGEYCYVEAGDRHLDIFCSLLGLEHSQMSHWLCNRKLVTVTDSYVTPKSLAQAVAARDALAKHLYGQLFEWTVTRVNRALSAGAPRHAFTGVLDIYGFETFQVNSFEQFCINYANEKLQHQFNSHVFQLEQAEYIQEQIPWTLIDFCDNQPCIDLIEGRLGILDLLDEECKMPKGSDASWAQKLYDRHLQTPHFHKPRLSCHSFTVQHFADMVEYACAGFLEKNRDSVYEEPIRILRAGKSYLVSELFQEEPRCALGSPRRVTERVKVRPCRKSLQTIHAENRKTIGCQFRGSLQKLMSVLNSTTPHYVRCIKPNDHKKPFLFEPQRAAQQLRACGVLETIRISAAGYPSRWTYSEFFSRYRVLIRPAHQSAGEKESCQRTLQELLLDPSTLQFGKTKVFFRAGQVALLENLRGRKLRQVCVTLQRRLRGWVARRRYLQLRAATLTLQTRIRGMLARRLLLFLQRSRAALTLQAQYRMFTARRRFLSLRSAVITLQKYTRGLLARNLYHQIVRERKALVLQSAVRGWLARRRFAQIRAATLYLQCCYRRMKARRELLLLRVEARSVQRYLQLNKGLEIKIVQLQCRINEQGGELQDLRRECTRASARLCEEWERVEHMEALRAELQSLRAKLQRESHEHREREDHHARERSSLLQRLSELEEEGCALREELDKTQGLKEQWLELESTSQMAERAEALTLGLVSERGLHQNLLSEFSKLEQRNENLQEELSYNKTVLALSAEREEAEALRIDDLSHACNEVLEANRLLEGGRQELPEVEQFESEQLLITETLQMSAGQGAGPDLSVEVTRLSQENQSLQEQLKKQEKNVLKLKKHLKLYMRREPGASVSSVFREPSRSSQEMCRPPDLIEQVIRPWQGMLVCHPEDEPRLIQTIITDLSPQSVLDGEPVLPAYVLFMCFRHADYCSAEHRVLSLFMATVTAIKRVVKEHSCDFELLSFWLSNTVRLMHCIKQYSGDRVTSQENSADQNRHCLRNFDLSSHWQSLESLCARIYQQLVRAAERRLQPMIIPSMLENDSIQRMSCKRVLGSRYRDRAGTTPCYSLDSLLLLLSSFHTALQRCHLQDDVSAQLLRQLLRTLTSTALNHLLLCRDMCCWSRGLQIRYNVSQLEEWLRGIGLHTERMMKPLEPLIHASQLLQVKKRTEDDAVAVCTMCTALSPVQVVKILSLYTPLNEFEERVSPAFIHSVQGRLQDRARAEGTSQLLADVNLLFPVRFLYSRSTVCLDQICLPQGINLSFLRRL